MCIRDSDKPAHFKETTGQLEDLLTPSLNILSQPTQNSNQAIFFSALNVFDLTMNAPHRVQMRINRNIGAHFAQYQKVLDVIDKAQALLSQNLD